MTDQDCVFCKIARGQVPARRIYEDDVCVAFLDIGPLAEGHTLIIPRQHFRDIRDIPPDVLAAVMSPMPMLASALMRTTDATGINMLHNTGLTAGQAVFHYHVHLIPRVEGDGLGFIWNAGKYEDDRADELQAQLVEALAAARA